MEAVQDSMWVHGCCASQLQQLLWDLHDIVVYREWVEEKMALITKDLKIGFKLKITDNIKIKPRFLFFIKSISNYIIRNIECHNLLTGRYLSSLASVQSCNPAALASVLGSSRAQADTMVAL